MLRMRFHRVRRRGWYRTRSSLKMVFCVRVLMVMTCVWTCLLCSIQTPVLAQTRSPKSVAPVISIQIRTSNPVLYVYENGHVVHTYPVALGTSETPTPIGQWQITSKQKNWGGGFGTRWLGLNVPWGTYGIHGTNRPESIGKYASNGCIRMRNEDVEQLYPLVSVGTHVTISGDPLKHPRTLVRGNIGADVRLVQQRLHQVGFFPGVLNGKFAAGTELCVSLYELAHHLPMDGVVGTQVYQSLGLV